MCAIAAQAVTSDFASVVRHRSWDWLTALQRRLNVERLQILDEHGLPIMPEAAPPWTVTLHTPEVTAISARALQSKLPESVRVGHLQLACVGLVAGHVRGTMVLARSVSEATARKGQTELELIATWLRPAIEAHLGSASPDPGEPAPRVSSLFKVLNTPAEGRSETSLLRLFANALAIWHDIDSRAYVEDVEGNFRLDVALPGAPAADVPTILHGEEIAVGVELALASSHELDLLGFRAGDHVMAARVGTSADGKAWLLVLSGGVESAGEGRLSLYTDVLRQALQNVAAASLLGVERTVWRHLVSATDHMPAAAEAALGELRTAVQANSAALSMSLPRTGQFVRVGDVGLLDDVGPSRSDRLTTTVRIDEGGTLVLTVQEPSGRFFTSRDQRIVETSGQLFGSWAGGVLRRAPGAFERRAVARPFEEVLEQAATQSAAQGATVCVVVLEIPEVERQSSIVQRLAGRIRANLRAGEPVGVLSGGEIGMLLYDCTPDVAHAVVARLRDVIGSGDGVTALAAALVGIAHSAPGSAAHQLVRAARADIHATSSTSTLQVDATP